MLRRILSSTISRNFIVQKITAQNNTAKKSLATILAADSKNPECKLSNVLKKWKKIFAEQRIDEPESSIENIVAHVLNTKQIYDVYSNDDRVMSLSEMDRITKMCQMRLKQMPIQYIIGEWDFKDMRLKMKQPVFIPRPETEQLVDLILHECNADRRITEFLELCCGSGAISLALLKGDERLKCIAIDKSEEACQLTRENAAIHNLEDRISIIQKTIDKSNVDNFLNKKFKLIVSNAPYVPTGDLHTLQAEVKQYEDMDALDGGTDGLRLIKLVLQISSRLLEIDGKVILEVDRWHPELLRSHLEENPALGLEITSVHKDLFKRDRFVTAKKI